MDARCELCWRALYGVVYDGTPTGRITPVIGLLPPLQGSP